MTGRETPAPASGGGNPHAPPVQELDARDALKGARRRRVIREYEHEAGLPSRGRPSLAGDSAEVRRMTDSLRCRRGDWSVRRTGRVGSRGRACAEDRGGERGQHHSPVAHHRFNGGSYGPVTESRCEGGEYGSAGAV